MNGTGFAIPIEKTIEPMIMTAGVAEGLFFRLLVMVDSWQYYSYQFISLALLALFCCRGVSWFWFARSTDTNKHHNGDTYTDTYHEFHILIIAEKDYLIISLLHVMSHYTGRANASRSFVHW